MANGDRNTSRKREGSKGPVLPAVKDVDRVHSLSPPFEGSRSYLGTVSSPHVKEDLLLEIGVNDLEMLLVNYKKFDAEAHLLTAETKPLKPGLSGTLMLVMIARLS